jgi:RNA polymerase sigma-70 factor (ECF subfamily)
VPTWKKDAGWWRTYKMLVSIAVTTPAEPSPDEASRRARLDALFTSHAAEVFAFARRRASRSEADDVVSETFLVAWRRLDAVPDRPLPWLLGVVVVVVVAARSRARRIASSTRSSRSVVPPTAVVALDMDGAAPFREPPRHDADKPLLTR